MEDMTLTDLMNKALEPVSFIVNPSEIQFLKTDQLHDLRSEIVGIRNFMIDHLEILSQGTVDTDHKFFMDHVHKNSFLSLWGYLSHVQLDFTGGKFFYQAFVEEFDVDAKKLNGEREEAMNNALKLEIAKIGDVITRIQDEIVLRSERFTVPDKANKKPYTERVKEYLDNNPQDGKSPGQRVPEILEKVLKIEFPKYYDPTDKTTRETIRKIVYRHKSRRS